MMSRLRLRWTMTVALCAAHYEDEARFVVTRGCVPELDADAQVRVFVAVPSASSNFRRRQWVRATWCSQPSTVAGASFAAKFFIGVGEELSQETQLYHDIVRVPSWDGVDNVTAKQLHSFRYFAMLLGDDIGPHDWAMGTAGPTHYARFEDDVYVNVGLFLSELRAGVILAVPGPAHVVITEQFCWANFVQGSHRYPSGSGFILSRQLVRAIVATDRVSALDVGAPAAEGTRLPGGKGGFFSDGRWSTDDSWVGMLLATLRHAAVNDRRFHELPGRGLTAWPASADSLALSGLRHWTDFELAHGGRYAELNSNDDDDGLVHDPDSPTSTLWMEVDGLSEGIRLDGCDDGLAKEACDRFRLDERMCSAFSSHLAALCPQAARHAASFS